MMKKLYLFPMYLLSIMSALTWAYMWLSFWMFIMEQPWCPMWVYDLEKLLYIF